jgi:S-adenosylmethionine decarboxylase
MDPHCETVAATTLPDAEPVNGPHSQAAAEWIIDAAGCAPHLLADVDHLQHICDAIVTGLELRVVGEPCWHRFPKRADSTAPGGATGLYLLAESHLTCHTFPEMRLAAFNLYCCRTLAPWDWNEFLRDRLDAATVVVRTVTRGLAAVTDAREEAR